MRNWGQEQGHLGRALGANGQGRGRHQLAKGDSLAEVRKVTEGQGPQAPLKSKLTGQSRLSSKAPPDPASRTLLGTKPNASQPPSQGLPPENQLILWFLWFLWHIPVRERAALPRAGGQEQGFVQPMKDEGKQQMATPAAAHSRPRCLSWSYSMSGRAHQRSP